LGIIQVGWVGLSVHTYKFTRPFSKHSLRERFLSQFVANFNMRRMLAI
jgi:hypothetical protein